MGLSLSRAGYLVPGLLWVVGGRYRAAIPLPGVPVSAQRIELEDERPEVIIRDMLNPYRAIDDFLDDCRRRGYSERTLTTYKRLLEAFADRLPLDYDVSQISEDDTRRYLGSNRNKLAQGTIAHREAVVSSWLKWLYKNRKIKTNPMVRLDRTKRIPACDLDVVTVSSEDVPKLLRAAEALDAAASSEQDVWTHRVCLMVLVYMGPRRRAVARLRSRDYDRPKGQLRFQEKGGKTIWKPIPDDLRELLEAADRAGVWVKPTDFLVPPAPHAVYQADVLEGKRDRDDRCIWEIVKDVGRKAGVKTHVHALRAAFAVFYLEQNTGDLEGLKEILGHSQLATTQTYLRKLDKTRAMERVRSLSWTTGEAA